MSKPTNYINVKEDLKPPISKVGRNESFLRDFDKLMTGFANTFGTAATIASGGTRRLRPESFGNDAGVSVQGLYDNLVDYTKPKVEAIKENFNMKKRKNKKEIPSYAFGLEQGLLGGQFLTGLTDGLFAGQENQYGKPSNAQIGASTAKGAATGAISGLAVGGPIGAAAGGLIGGITSLIGGNRRRKQALELERKTNNAADQRIGQQNTLALQQDYYSNNDLAYTFANGGFMPQDLAYLDNNEVIRDTYGNIGQVPNTTVGTDKHLVDATNLESVLSDTLVIPDTNITFAEMGAKLKNTYKDSKGKDRFAETTNRLNKDRLNRDYDNLLTQQELMKQKKGIKNKKKQVPQYALGYADDNLYYADSLLPEIIVTAPRLNTGNTLLNAPATIPGVGYDSGTYSAARQNMPTTFDRSSINWSTNSNNTVDTKKGTQQTRGALDYINNLDFGSIASLAPVLSNVANSRRSAEIEPVVTNPYGAQALAALSQRRFNTQPITEANRRSRSIANYNASRLNPNTGANQAYRTQLAASEYAANADLHSLRQNTNNQYLADYANMLGNLGQQTAAATVRANEVNAANRAARRNYSSTAATQFGQWAQNQQQMTNQRRKDAMVYPLLEDFLSQGYSADKIAELRNQYFRRAA